MYCSKCGQKLNTDSKFCVNCGASVEKNQFDVHSKQNNFFCLNKIKDRVKQFGINKILVFAIVLVIIVIFIGTTFVILGRNKSRTIMIYMVGADLESKSGLASVDLSYLDYEKTSDNRVNVILMAGGSKNWKNSYVDATETSIYELKESGFVKVDNRSVENMGAADNLSYFLNYGYNNYKTTKYDLLFWDHGAAVNGSEFDEISADHLSLLDMRSALEKSPFNSKNRLEVVSFRTCLNATIEVANVYSEYADYLVASEEVTVGSVFASALSFINNISPEDSAIDYGMRQIGAYKDSVVLLCNNYSTSKSEENYCVDSTYSIIDLKKISNVSESFDSFFNDVSNNLSTSYDDIAKKRAKLDQYCGDEPAYDMVDFYELINSYRMYSISKADKVLSDLGKAIVYNFSTNSYSHGLSIYHPYNSTAFLDSYRSISVANSYSDFVYKFSSLKNNMKIDSFSNFSNTSGVVNKKSKEKADFELELTDEQVKNYAKANYFVFVDTKDGYHQLLYAGKDVKLDGNKLKAKVQGKQLRFSDIEYEDVSCWIPLIEKEVTDDYVDVTSTTILSSGAFNKKVATITIRIDDKHPNGHIISAVINNSENDKSSNLALFSNNGVRISDYTSIEFASQRWKILDENGNFNPDFVGNGIYRGLSLLTDEFKFIREDFDSEYDYYALFRIWDTANNDYYSKLVKMDK